MTATDELLGARAGYGYPVSSSGDEELAALVASAAGPDVDLRDETPLSAKPPQISLLTSAIDVTAILQATYGGEHWLNGIAFEPEGGALNLVTEFPYWWTCPETTVGGGFTAIQASPGGVKVTPAKPTNIANRPLVAHTADSCLSTFGMLGRQTPERARRLLEANLPRIIENELWTGARSTLAGFSVAGPPIRNDFLTNAPTLLPGAQGYANALAELEQAYFDRDNRPGMVHAQPRVVELWVRDGMCTLSPSGKQLKTALGTIVVPGSGYPGGSTAAGVGTRTSSFAFITGPVCYARTPIEIQRDLDTGDGSDGLRGEIAWHPDGTTGVQDRNTRAECYFSVFWDSKVKVGVNVNPLAELA